MIQLTNHELLIQKAKTEIPRRRVALSESLIQLSNFIDQKRDRNPKVVVDEFKQLMREYEQITRMEQKVKGVR